jgi:hypothetical protein
MAELVTVVQPILPAAICSAISGCGESTSTLS